MKNLVRPVLWIQSNWICIRIQVRIRIQGYSIMFRKKIYNNFREKQFLKMYIFLNCKKKMSSKEFFSELSRCLWIVSLNLKLNLVPFASILSYIYICGSGSVFGIRIRIHKAPEYGSNTDPIRIHYTEKYEVQFFFNSKFCALFAKMVSSHLC